MLALRSWILPALVFVVFRLIDAIFLGLAASRQIRVQGGEAIHVEAPMPADPGFWAFMANWDGQWYKTIALHGYPTQLPEVAGVVQQNEWAFYPVYPTLVRALMAATGLSFEVAATTVSLVCGTLASVVLYRLVCRYATRFAAFATCVCLSAFVSAPILQMAYTESIALLILALALTAWADEQWALLGTLGVLLSLTRPVAPALAAAMALHLYLRWRGRRESRIARQQLVKQLVAVIVIAGSAALWPAVAGAVTHRPRAYFETTQAWPAYSHHSFGFGWVGGLVQKQAWLLLTVVVLVTGINVLAHVRRQGAEWGPQLRAWGAVYPVYLLLATAPGPSLPRYLLLAITPMWPFPDARGSDEQGRPEVSAILMLGGLVAVGLTLQYLWTMNIVAISHSPTEQAFP